MDIVIFLFLGVLLNYSRSFAFDEFLNNRRELWKIYFNHFDDIRKYGPYVKELGLSEWRRTRNYVEFTITQNNTKAFDEFLKAKKIDYKIVIKDVEQAIKNEVSVNIRNIKKNGGVFNYEGYYRYTPMMSYLSRLTLRCPDRCEIIKIGKTIENRDIIALRILPNGNNNNKSILIDGGIHAREWISPASVMRIAEKIIDIITQPQFSISVFIKYQDWYIIPVLNPDGYEFSHVNKNNRFWRKNRRVIKNNKGERCIGVDLNRNFGYKHGEQGSSKECTSEVFSSQRPFTERETRSVRRLINRRIKNLHTYLSFHSYGQMILHPYDYDENISCDLKYLYNIAKHASNAAFIVSKKKHRYQYGSFADLIGPASGTSNDWIYHNTTAVCSFAIELRGDENGFLLPAHKIDMVSMDAILISTVLIDACYRVENKTLRY